VDVVSRARDASRMRGAARTVQPLFSGGLAAPGPGAEPCPGPGGGLRVC
jgi:hypothetical protein